MKPERTYSPAELGRVAGLSPDTVRHYEKLGVLPRAARTTAGYRRYGEEAVERLHLAQSAMRIGFTLREIGEVLRVRDSGGAPCQRVFKMTQEKLHETVRQIRELRRTERYIRQVIKSWSGLLAQAGPGRRAFLLRGLASGA